MKLFKYAEFINESQLYLILEANIEFSQKFKNILKVIDSPIAKKLIDVEGNEVDINQNYIDINKDKTDTLLFKPDDKVGKVAIVKAVAFLTQLCIDLSKIPNSGVELKDSEMLPEDMYVEENQIVQIIKEFTLQELTQNIEENKLDNSEIYLEVINSTYKLNNPLVLIQWVKNRKKIQNIILKNSLTIGPEAIRNSEIGVGRFVRSLLTKSGQEFTDAEIEEFVYKYRAEIEKEKDAFNKRFRVVSGKDIKTYYHRNSYFDETGSLGSSCMRYDRCQKYLDIYTNNSQVSLLILLSEEDTSKITGRAILWEMEPYEFSTKVMDRIYTIKTADEQLFKEWAIANKYWFKSRQDFSEYTDFEFHKKGGEVEKRAGEFSVKLDNNGEYDYYPYMDSFKYYHVRKGMLFNSSNASYDYELVDTEGGNNSCSDCGGSGRVECGDCDGDGTTTCNSCSGRGTQECSECDGSGEEECHICDGAGDSECSTCDGEGKEDCDDCGGDGEIDGENCDSCSGSGKKECSDCDGGGRKQCYKCDGDGNIQCGNCEGEGREDCDDCDGDGEVECSNCDGNGRHDCYECN